MAGKWIARFSARVSIRFSLSSLTKERYQLVEERIARASVCLYMRDDVLADVFTEPLLGLCLLKCAAMAVYGDECSLRHVVSLSEPPTNSSVVKLMLLRSFLLHP